MENAVDWLLGDPDSHIKCFHWMIGIVFFFLYLTRFFATSLYLPYIVHRPSSIFHLFIMAPTTGFWYSVAINSGLALLLLSLFCILRNKLPVVFEPRMDRKKIR